MGGDWTEVVQRTDKAWPALRDVSSIEGHAVDPQTSARHPTSRW
jgi:hypothetical protein